MAGRGERWDRDRFVYEQDRERDRYEDDRFSMRGGRRGDDRGNASNSGRGYDDDIRVRDRASYDYEPRRERERDSGGGREYDRTTTIERDRERDVYRSPSPRRPSFLRRQSSLDTFDRRPLNRFYEREEYGPPARREDVRPRDDYRVPPYTDIPIPLPPSRGLPPPRRSGERIYYDDLDDLPQEHIHEREVVRSRERRDRSRESHTSRATRTSKAHTHRSSSKASKVTSRSSSSSSGGTTIKSEYPKKGKTRVPARLVSKRALIDLGYPFVEEGNTIIVQKALGQDNIDELLKLSEDYKRSKREGEAEVAAARSSAGDFEEIHEEIFVPPAPSRISYAPAPIPPPPPAAPTTVMSPPPQQFAPATVVEAGPVRVGGTEYERTVYRDVSPARTGTSYSSHAHQHQHYEGALVERSRSRSQSRGGRELRSEIRALERELAHRPKGELTERFTERLPSGELIVYEESIEKVAAPPKPPRLEKDKKGPPPGLVRAMLATLT